MAETEINTGGTITHRRLQALLDHHGITRSRACRLAGVDLNVLRRFKQRPQGGMRVDTLAKLADVLGCDVAYLTGDSDEIELGEPGLLGRPKPTRAPPSILAMRIRHFRVLRFKSQVSLARKIGVSKSLVSSWEVGITEPNDEQRAQLGEIFGADLTTDVLEPEIEADLARIEQVRARKPLAVALSTNDDAAAVRLHISKQGAMARITIDATVPWEIGVQIASLIREHAVPKPTSTS